MKKFDLIRFLGLLIIALILFFVFLILLEINFDLAQEDVTAIPAWIILLLVIRTILIKWNKN